MIGLVLTENSIQLVPDGTLLIHMTAIVIMVAVLNATLFKPINRILAGRERRSKGRLGEAAQILKTVDQKIAAYESRLRAARADAYELLEAEQSAARKAREGALGRVRDELVKSTEHQKKALAKRADKVRKALAANADELGHEVGSRILGRRV